jgi:SPP1 family predicted phage head-tail adaptor
MNIRPGELDQRISILRETLSDDGFGGQNVALAVLSKTTWAHVRPMSGRESERFDKLNAEMTNLFVIRYRSDVQENDRIEWLSEQYNIRAVMKSGPRKLYLEIYAERGVAL